MTGDVLATRCGFGQLEFECALDYGKDMHGSAVLILKEILSIITLLVRWVSRLIIFDNKRNRLTTSKECLVVNSNSDEIKKAKCGSVSRRFFEIHAEFSTLTTFKRKEQSIVNIIQTYSKNNSKKHFI